jgi:hypothetical protein
VSLLDDDCKDVLRNFLFNYSSGGIKEAAFNTYCELQEPPNKTAEDYYRAILRCIDCGLMKTKSPRDCDREELWLTKTMGRRREKISKHGDIDLTPKGCCVASLLLERYGFGVFVSGKNNISTCDYVARSRTYFKGLDAKLFGRVRIDLFARKYKDCYLWYLSHVNDPNDELSIENIEILRKTPPRYVSRWWRTRHNYIDGGYVATIIIIDKDNVDWFETNEEVADG